MSIAYDLPYRDITVHVRHKKVKHLKMRVDAQGKLFLSVPESSSMNEILGYLEKYYDWTLDLIEEQKERYDASYKPEEVVVGGITMQVQRRRRVTTMRVRTVAPFGTVVITVPSDVTTEEIVRFVTPHLSGIKQSLKKMRRKYPQPLRYESGEIHKLWGEPYALKVVHGPSKNIGVTVEKDGLEKYGLGKDGMVKGVLVLTVPQDATFELRRRVMQYWYQKKVYEALNSLVPYWEGVIGVRLEDWSCRSMKTRWGSCTPERRTIRLNSALAMHPREILEYVLVHEMCHVLVRRHTVHFYDILEKHYPERAQAEAYLHEVATSAWI